MKDLKLEIEYLPLERLTPYKNNAKLHPQKQIDEIKRSIDKFGMNDPIAICGKENIIVEGHGRLLACQQLGLKEVPVIRLDHLTEDERKAYTLAHNKLTMNTDFDLDLLKSELQDIDLDMGDFGFEMEMEELNLEDEAEIEEDEIPEPPAEPKAKLGEIYRLGDHYLMCGDSTNPSDLEQLMSGDGDKAELAEMVFTDPPWNVAYGSQQNHPSWKQRTILNDSMSTEQFKEFMDGIFSCMKTFSKAGAPAYVVMSAQEWGNLMLSLKEHGFHWSSTIIWAKDSLVLSRKDYHTQYEPIWYGWEDSASRLHPLQDRTQSDLWQIPRPKKSEEHPTMKPVELVARAITNSSDKGNIVLDLFGGSGTTLIAAEQTGRRCRMMELDPKYVDVIINRWENLSGKKAEKVNN